MFEFLKNRNNKPENTVSVSGKIENIANSARVKLEIVDVNNPDTIKIVFNDIPFTVKIDAEGKLRNQLIDELTNEFQKVLKYELKQLSIELAEKLEELQK